jgi:hypothetical protein
VYETPCESVVALANLRSSLSRSLESTAISERKGEISSPRQCDRVKNRSAKRGAGSMGRVDAGKKVRTRVVVSLAEGKDER